MQGRPFPASSLPIAKPLITIPGVLLRRNSYTWNIGTFSTTSNFKNKKSLSNFGKILKEADIVNDT